jgi:hypothetical protein
MGDTLQTIVVAVICLGEKVLIGTMSPDAKNKLAGEDCFPGTRVRGDRTSRVDLVKYLTKAIGLHLDVSNFSRVICTWDRTALDPDGSRRFVRHVYLLAELDPEKDWRVHSGEDMINMRWVPKNGPGGVQSLIIETKTSDSRTPVHIFSALNGH